MLKIDIYYDLPEILIQSTEIRKSQKSYLGRIQVILCAENTDLAGQINEKCPTRGISTRPQEDGKQGRLQGRGGS